MEETQPPHSAHPPGNDSTAAACERCGSFDVLEIAGQFLCADCVAVAGCGCAGHGDETD
jgi:hypothetical protein